MANKRKGAGQQKQQHIRVDRKHRFPLRIDEVYHKEIEALAFKHNLSLNLVYGEAVRWAQASDAFRSHLDTINKRDERRGHFVFVTNNLTERPGRLV